MVITGKLPVITEASRALALPGNPAVITMSTARPAAAPSRVQHQLGFDNFELDKGKLAFARVRRRHGVDSTSILGRSPRRITPGASAEYLTSPPAAAADTQAPGRRPPDAGAGPVFRTTLSPTSLFDTTATAETMTMTTATKAAT